jgi:hypothetical protein
MINISANKPLDVILTNTNRALAEVVKDASPKELATISQGKDLKSIMSSLLKQSAQDSSADKTLLNLVKNNPTLKNLSSISQSVKDLLGSLKSDASTLPLEKTLKNFLIDIQNIKEPALKQKLENSGVFLESRLKNAQNPQVELRTTLEQLTKTLDKSKIFNVIMLSKDLKELLNSKTITDSSNKELLQTPKESPKELQSISKKLSETLVKLQEHIHAGDTLNSKTFTTALSKLEHLVEPKLLTPQNFKLSSIENSLTELGSQLSTSSKPEAKGLLDALSKIFTALKSLPQTTSTTTLESLMSKKIPQDIKSFIESSKNILNKSDVIFSKETHLSLEKLTNLHSPKELASHQNVKDVIANDLKSVLLQAGSEVTKSSHPNQSEILRHIDKLTLTIDYHQLVSHLSNSTSLSLPFSYEQLQEGHIEFKRDKENRFYCDINLKLKEYGELNLKLTLYDKNQLNIHIYSNNAEFKEMIKENIPSLRSALIENQITPREIRLFEPKTESKKFSPYETQAHPIDVGFEVKV